MVRKKIETKVKEIVEDIKEEAVENVTTFSINRWQVLGLAAVVTLITLVVLF